MVLSCQKPFIISIVAIYSCLFNVFMGSSHLLLKNMFYFWIITLISTLRTLCRIIQFAFLLSTAVFNHLKKKLLNIGQTFVNIYFILPWLLDNYAPLCSKLPTSYIHTSIVFVQLQWKGFTSMLRSNCCFVLLSFTLISRMTEILPSCQAVIRQSFCYSLYSLFKIVSDRAFTFLAKKLRLSRYISRSTILQAKA